MDQPKEQAHRHCLHMDQTEQVVAVEAVEQVVAAFEMMIVHLEEVGSETPLPIFKKRERGRGRCVLVRIQFFRIFVEEILKSLDINY